MDLDQAVPWNRCPYCKSNKIHASSPDIGDGQVWIGVICADCDSQWNEIYEASEREAI